MEYLELSSLKGKVRIVGVISEGRQRGQHEERSGGRGEEGTSGSDSKPKRKYSFYVEDECVLLEPEPGVESEEEEGNFEGSEEENGGDGVAVEVEEENRDGNGGDRVAVEVEEDVNRGNGGDEMAVAMEEEEVNDNVSGGVVVAMEEEEEGVNREENGGTVTEVAKEISKEGSVEFGPPQVEMLVAEITSPGPSTSDESLQLEGNMGILSLTDESATATSRLEKKRKLVEEPCTGDEVGFKKVKGDIPSSENQNQTVELDTEQDLEATAVQYEVEKVIDSKIGDDGKAYYLVRWAGWDDAWNEWVDAQSCFCTEAIEEYWKAGFNLINKLNAPITNFDPTVPSIVNPFDIFFHKKFRSVRYYK